MEVFDNLLFGFSVAFTTQHLLYCLLGAMLGTLVGVLPGLNPLVVITMLLPVTFRIPATDSLIMLSGIYYGAHHAGSTTAIMLNMPGEPTAVVICLDGYPMAKQGRAGPALFITAIGSFFAGCVSVLIITLFSPPLARAALAFQAPEYASIVVLALVGASVLSGSSILSNIAMAVVGLLLGTVGTDLTTGVMRFTFGDNRLADGVDFVTVAMGLFAFSEVAYTLGAPEVRMKVETEIRNLIPTREEFRASVGPILRGTGLGSAFGILPGTGPLVASFGSYALETRLAKDPKRFGRGAIEGVAGPEAANNAAAFTHYIPMLTLGIPAGATMALMLGAMIIQGITPGPGVLTDHPDLFWGLIASMWIGNLMLLVLNLPLVGIWVRLLAIPYRFLYPMVLAFCCIGVFTVSNSSFNVRVAAIACAIGFVFRLLDCSPASLILGLVLGPLLEENFRRSMIISRGDPTIFLTRPISLFFLVLLVALLLLFSLPAFNQRLQRSEAAQDSEDD